MIELTDNRALHRDGRVDVTVWTGDSESIRDGISLLNTADQHPQVASDLVCALALTLDVLSERGDLATPRMTILMDLADRVIASDHPVLSCLTEDCRQQLGAARSAALVRIACA